jgi:hypothetical protein
LACWRRELSSPVFARIPFDALRCWPTSVQEVFCDRWHGRPMMWGFMSVAGEGAL